MKSMTGGVPAALTVVLASLAGAFGTCHVAEAGVVLSDNFDSYADQAALDAVWGNLGTSATLVSDRSRSPSQALYQGTSAQASLRSFAGVMTSELHLSFWFYDGGTNLGRQWVEVEAQGSSGLEQLLAIGKYNATPTSKYSGRVAFGGINWFTLDGAADRSVGWHLMEIVARSDGTVDWIVDGVLGASQTVGEKEFNWVQVGSNLSSETEGWYDDLVIEAIPEPTTMALVGLGLAGFCARRRRR